jgi:hypothetical protein
LHQTRSRNPNPPAFNDPNCQVHYSPYTRKILRNQTKNLVGIWTTQGNWGAWRLHKCITLTISIIITWQNNQQKPFGPWDIQPTTDKHSKILMAKRIWPWRRLNRRWKFTQGKWHIWTIIRWEGKKPIWNQDNYKGARNTPSYKKKMPITNNLCMIFGASKRWH